MISIVNRGDGKPSSLSGIQFGWHVSYMIWRAVCILVSLYRKYLLIINIILDLMHMLCITPRRIVLIFSSKFHMGGQFALRSYHYLLY